MSQDTVYRLSKSACAEPLVSNWVAYWLTTAPVPASLHVHGYQVPLMKAYLQSPAFHAKSERDPKLSGGSFVGVPANRAEDVRKLLQRTIAEQADRLRLAEALEEFQDWLFSEARGQSLEPLYAKVPEPLKGLVELVYDFNNRPFVRVLEGLTYRSRYFMPQLQTIRLFPLKADLDRRSLFSTPRVYEEGQLEWKVRFSDERIDRLSALDLEPKPLGEIRDILGMDVPDEQLLPLLTREPAPAVAPWQGPGARVRYLGHATVLVEWKGVSILTDPVLSPFPLSGGMERMSYAELPRRIDYALVTHCHGDHYFIETLLRLRHRIQHLVVPRSNGLLTGDASLKLLSTALGFKSVIDVDNYDTLPLPDGEIVAVPFLGEHGDVAQSKSGYVIRAGKEQILFAADSTCLDENVYRRVREDVGEISTVFMNTETDGSPLTFTIEALFSKKRDRKLEKNRRCRGSNAAEGLRLLETVGAKRVFNYAMGLEPWLEHIIGPASAPESVRMKDSDTLLEEARRRGLLAERMQGPKEFVL